MRLEVRLAWTVGVVSRGRCPQDDRQSAPELTAGRADGLIPPTQIIDPHRVCPVQRSRLHLGNNAAAPPTLMVAPGAGSVSRVWSRYSAMRSSHWIIRGSVSS